MIGTNYQEVSCLATEEEGPSVDLSRLSSIILNETELARLPRGTEIFVYMGFVEDTSTLSPIGYGTLLGYDPQRREVRYRTIPDPPGLGGAPQGGGLRAMITDRSSGLMLPKGVHDDEPPVEKRVLLDEGYLILDGTAYSAYSTDPENWNPGDTLYD